MRCEGSVSVPLAFHAQPDEALGETEDAPAVQGGTQDETVVRASTPDVPAVLALTRQDVPAAPGELVVQAVLQSQGVPRLQDDPQLPDVLGSPDVPGSLDGCLQERLYGQVLSSDVPQLQLPDGHGSPQSAAEDHVQQTECAASEPRSEAYASQPRTDAPAE